MDTLDIKQGTEAWRAIRAGKVTASRIADVMAKIKTGEASSRRNYRAELVAERMSGVQQEGFVSGPMKWGIEQEPFARAAYELARGLFVDQVGFIDHPVIPLCGASPDGLVGDGLVEIKCPNTDTHIQYLKAGAPPVDYFKQMQWQMECSGRTWCDFVSYDPRMPKSHRLFIRRLLRDDRFLDEARREVIAFGKEVEAEVAAILETTPFYPG